MAKYRNAYRDEPDELTQEAQLAPTTNPTAPPANADEESFKKRYGDLRRHMQQQMAQRDQEINQMQSQLNDATRGQIKFPKSEEEVEAWSSKYPDVAKIIDTIAQKRIKEVYDEAKVEIQDIKKQQQGIKTEKAMLELKKIHPDFDKIRASKEFHDWVSEQPRNVQDSLYKNNTDPRAAARAIDLYKSDKGIRRVRSKNSSAAAQAIGRSGVAAPTSGRSMFTESQVQSMSAADYEKNEAKIMESISKGLFEYDVTGGAR
tara:strand:+ start:3008 stop:3787 length:780 start_codon:yes stop_codon:yes gene_type:complete